MAERALAEWRGAVLRREASRDPSAPTRERYDVAYPVEADGVGAASGTFGVRLELPNPTDRLPAGLKCKVRFGR